MSKCIYPVVRCYSPRKIVNAYTGESMVVPCGHCAACALRRASFLATWCEMESQTHKYTVFITLTYSNRFVPRAKVCGSLDRPYDYDLVSDDGEVLAPVGMSEEKLELFLKKLYLFGDVPYLRKEDLQKFFKRFRYYAKKTSKSKVRYFACGEYGPVRFRPHFHILLFFDDPSILQVCESCVLASWPFGRVDVQTVNGSASSYVAGYVNSNVALPQVLKAPTVCPFCVHSQRLGKGILDREREKVYAETPDDFIKRSFISHGKYREITLPSSFQAFYFPKCKGYSIKSKSARLQSYRIYDTAKRAFPETSSCLGLAKEIALCNYFFPSCVSAPFDIETRKVLDYFNEPAPDDVESLEFTKYINRIYNELLVSRHFIDFCCYGRTDFRTCEAMVDKIDAFYSRLDYLHLTSFFESQQLFYDSNLYGSDDLLSDGFDNTYYPYFYNNIAINVQDYTITPAYQLMRRETAKLAYDRIKHKKLNDLNNFFIFDE